MNRRNFFLMLTLPFLLRLQTGKSQVISAEYGEYNGFIFIETDINGNHTIYK